MSLKQSMKPGDLTDYLEEMKLRTTLTIELKLEQNPEDVESKKAMRTAIKSAATILLTQAVLMSGKRKPSITVRSDSLTEGVEILDLEDEDDL